SSGSVVGTSPTSPRRREVMETAAMPRESSMPVASPGQRIGLFGGSFNPAHAAHRTASLLGWKRLGLDRVWWLVSPGNPLKDTRDLPPLGQRLAQARQVADSPFIEVTDIEARLGARYTYDTVTRITACYPRVRFVLLVG